jgi:hypothetical protein
MKRKKADKMILLLILMGANEPNCRGWDGTVDSFLWSKTVKVYFTAAVDGTKQL